MKQIISSLALLLTISSHASDLKSVISAQATTVFATADSKTSSDTAVCLEFGKLVGLGLAYKVTQPADALENYMNETTALYAESCKNRKLSKTDRDSISTEAQVIFMNIKN
jgi:hypothetical protein